MGIKMKKSKSINAEAAFPYIMILPTLSIIFIFLLYPIGNTFYLSTQNHVLTNLKDSGFIGLENFKTLSVDGVFWKSAFNSIIWTFANVGIQVVLGLITALLLNMDFKGRGLFRALMFTPWAVGGILVALIFGFMFNESIGVIGDLLMKLGLVNQKVSWFSSGNSSMLAIIIANTWRGVPFFTVSILSSLQTIPLEVYESADVDGANRLVKFSRITMPLIKDTLILTTLLRTIWTLNVVDLIYGMTNGGPNFSTLTIPVYIMKLFNESLNMGYASAVAVVMIILLMIFSAVYLKVGKYGEEEYY